MEPKPACGTSTHEVLLAIADSETETDANAKQAYLDELPFTACPCCLVSLTVLMMPG